MPARSPTATCWESGALRALRGFSDRDQRLPDAPREEALQPEQRHERVVQLERANGDRLAPQDPAGPPPAWNPGDVEVLDMRDAKSGRAQQLEQTGAGITAVMGEWPGPGAGQRWERREAQHEGAGRREPHAKRRPRPTRVRHVLEHAEGDDRVERRPA